MKNLFYFKSTLLLLLLAGIWQCQYEEVEPLYADFNVQGGSAQALAPVTFTDASVGAKTWAWNFGNGNTSNSKTPPAQTYLSEGTYAVSLTVTNGAGASDTKPINLSVGPPPQGDPVMKSIPDGTFTMGCNSNIDPNCNPWEQPTHSVTLSAYQISETEVTQAQWQALMGDNPSYFEYLNCPQCPVEQVSWYDAVVYCNRLSESEGKTPCYYSDPSFMSVYGKNQDGTWTLPNSGTVFWKTSAKGYRLPTEAEWERAARDGVSNQIYSGGNDINAVAWYNSNSGGVTRPVKQKPANGTPNYKLYDMSGNVWEWCFDWYDNYSSAAQNNPTGPSSSSGRVIRGGSWLDDPAGCRVAGRGYGAPDGRSYVLGFRLARTP